jgi:hypothetical protein
LSESSDPFPNRVFHAAISNTTPTTSTPVDGFFHLVDAEDGFT